MGATPRSLMYGRRKSGVPSDAHWYGQKGARMREEGAEIDLAVLRVAEAGDLVLTRRRLRSGPFGRYLRAQQRRHRAGEHPDQHAKGDLHARRCSRRPKYRSISPSTHRLGDGMERVMGSEPTLVAWEATVLPLNYTRAGNQRGENS